MSPEVTITMDSVHVSFFDEPATRAEMFEIVADYDLEGNPVGFEAFDFKSPPLGEINRLDTPQLIASFDSDENALAVWFKEDPRSRDQEVLDAEFGFSKNGRLVFVKYMYIRGGAAKSHSEARGWGNSGQTKN